VPGQAQAELAAQVTMAAGDPCPFAALLAAPRGEPVALLHSCGEGPAFLCTDAVAALTLPAGAWRGGFAQLHSFLQQHHQHWVVGWLGYDLGLDVEPWPQQPLDDFGAPVLHVAAYRRVQQFASAPVPPAPEVPPATALRAHVARADYERRVAAVIEHICA